MNQLIAVAGKGGTGKTTCTALLVRALLDKGIRPVLAVDADPNSTLAPLLGMVPGPTLGDLRDEAMAAKLGDPALAKDKRVEQRLHEFVAESAEADLLTMGRPEGQSCYCYVNTLLRDALARLRTNYPVTVVDNEAGMEHLSRMNTSDIDCLAVISEPTAVSARSALRIRELSRALGVRVRRSVLVWNKTGAAGVPGAVLQLVPPGQFDAVLFLPADDAVARLSVDEANALTAPLPAWIDKLFDICIMGREKNRSQEGLR